MILYTLFSSLPDARVVSTVVLKLNFYKWSDFLLLDFSGKIVLGEIRIMATCFTSPTRLKMNVS